MKTLKNVFVNTHDNYLKLADILFDSQINRVELLSVREIEWGEINTQDKLLAFISLLPERLSEPETNKDIIDGKYFLAIPGAIDPHVHFDTPGFELREDFEHASRAAASGGVTTIIDMPCTSIPPVTNADNLKIKLDAVKDRSLIDFAFWGGIGGDCFSIPEQLKKNIFELAEKGVAGFKVYIISGMEDFKDLTYEQIENVAQIVKKTGKPLAVHAEDKTIVLTEQSDRISRGLNSWQDYNASRSIKAETEAVNKLEKIAKRTGCRIHIVHLSSTEGLKIVKDYHSKKQNFTAETCPHYLHFTQKDFENPAIRNFLKTAPPVKFEKDRESLWSALAENKLVFVTTDHAGCNPDEEKSSEDFWEVYGGIPGVEHRVPYLFSEGFLKNRIEMNQTINLLSTNAADFFQLKSKGRLRNGCDADISLINLWASETITASRMHSKGRYTPFEGLQLNAVVEKTFLRGKMIMDRAKKFFGKTGYGKFVECK
jgi:allantoinase